MNKTNLQKALTVLIISALAAGIGCGNGKRGKREHRNVDRTGADANKAGNPAAVGPQKDANGNPLPAAPSADDKVATGERTKDDAVTPALGGADLAERTKKDADMDTIWKSLVESVDGVDIAKALEAGTYTFESSATELRIMPGNGNWLRALAQNTLGDGRLNTIQQIQYGLLPDNTVENGYTVLIPSGFVVETRAGQPKGNGVNWLFMSKLASLDKSLTSQGLKDALFDAGSTAPTASLVEILGGNLLDNTKKRVELKAWKTADSKVRFHLTINEIPKPQPEDNGPQEVRNIILTFKFEPKAVETATVTPVTPAAADAPPAQQPVEKIPVETDAD